MKSDNLWKMSGQTGDEPEVISAHKRILYEVDYDPSCGRPRFHCAQCPFNTEVQRRLKLHARSAHNARIGGYKIKKTPESKPIFSCARGRVQLKLWKSSKTVTSLRHISVAKYNIKLFFKPKVINWILPQVRIRVNFSGQAGGPCREMPREAQ